MALLEGTLLQARIEGVTDLGCQVLWTRDDQVCVAIIRLVGGQPERVEGTGPTVVVGAPPDRFVAIGHAERVRADGPVAWTQWGGLLFDLEALAVVREAPDEVGAPVLPLPDTLQELAAYPFFGTWAHPAGFVAGCRQAVVELVEDVMTHPGDATVARYAFARAVSRLNALEEATALICEDEAHDLITALEAVADAAGLDDMDVGEGRAW